MTNRPPPSLAKWPFMLTDIVLLIAFAWIIRYGLRLPPQTTGDYVALIVTIVGWMTSAWVCVLPWLKEYQAQSKYVELDSLTSAVEQIQKLEEVGSRVQAASANWQSAQDAAARVTAAARDVEERIKADSKEFMEFAERINNDEKQHLRLEVEKLRRAEGEWLQVSARMLDHTFAITTAAVRSGQPNLATQMTNFQSACREAARRVGLVPFHPGLGEAYDERSQQLEDPNAKPEEGSVVTDILATGYTFQGQLLRKALVRVAKPNAPTEQIEPKTESISLASGPGESIVPESQSQPQPEAEREPEGPSELEARHEHEQSSASDEAQAAAVVNEQIEESNLVASEKTTAEQPVASAEPIAVAAEADEMQAERNEPEPAEIPEGVEDFVVETYHPSEPNHKPVETAHHIANEEAVGADVPASAPTHGQAEVAEVTSGESVSEAPAEEKPRRRQRKSDPQTSLPF